MSYKRKDAVQLAYDANLKRIRAEGAIVLQTLLNEAISEMSDQFDAALARGELLELSGSRAEMQGFLRSAAQKQLGLAS